MMKNHFLTDELPSYAGADERIIDLQGETLKVLKALEAVVGHLRKFLVDSSVIPLFEKTVSLIFSKFLIKLKNSISLYTLYVKLQHYFGDVFKYHRRKCESHLFLISCNYSRH